MTATAASPADAAAPQAEEAWADRHVRLLAEMAEIGMELIRDLRDQAKTAPPADPAAVAPAFSRIGKAVRLSMALEAKVRLADRDDPVRQQERLAAKQAAERSAVPLAERRRKVLKIVVPDMIEAEVGQFPSEEEEELYGEADSLIDEEIDDETVLNRPMPELIAVICKALDVEPDWTLWDPAEWADDDCLTEAELAAGCPVKKPRRLEFEGPPPSAHPRESGDPGFSVHGPHEPHERETDAGA